MQNQSTDNSSKWTILKLLEWTSSYFKNRQVENPRASAEVLLAHALDTERIDLYLRYDQPLCNSELADFKALIKRRVRMEPVAYILGVKEFWSMDLAVTPDVLVPRPETECLVEAALSLLTDDSNTASRSIFDMGTGCGAIVLALASRQPQHIFFASDITREAIRVAQLNARRHGLDGLIHFFVGDWLAPVKDKTVVLDMIISNPPYIPSETIPRLQPEIYNYEPLLALDGDKDGLRCLRHIVGAAHRFLKPNGTLLLEFGHDQKVDLQRIIDRCGQYERVVYSKDYSGKDRVAAMHKRAG